MSGTSKLVALLAAAALVIGVLAAVLHLKSLARGALRRSGQAHPGLPRPARRRAEVVRPGAPGPVARSRKGHPGRIHVPIGRRPYGTLHRGHGRFRRAGQAGRKFRRRMAAFFLFEGANIVCERVYFDSATILRQLTG